MLSGESLSILIGICDSRALDVNTVGTKFRGLSRLRALDLPVPNAFCVPTPVVGEILEGGKKASENLESIIRETSSIFDLESGLAVRSSGIDEDLTTSSGAGKYRTVLNVRDPAGLRKAIGDLLSHYSELLKSGMASERFAIILQQMVHPDFAGVAFSRHPLQIDKDIVVIEAVEGLGDLLLSGEMKPVRLVLGPDPREGFLPQSTTGAFPMGKNLLINLREKVRVIEHEWGCPVDVEWAISMGQLNLLQARPATATAKSRPEGTWTRGFAEDLWGDPLCSLDASILTMLSPRFDLRRYAFRLGIPLDPTTPAITVIEGYLYVNAGLLASVIQSLPKGFNLRIFGTLLPPNTVLEAKGSFGPFLGRVFKLTLSDPQSNPLLCPTITRRKAKRILRALEKRPNPDPKDISALAAELGDLVALQGELLSVNQMPYLLTFLLTQAVEHLWHGRGSSEEKFALLSGCRTNPTYRMNSDLKLLGEALNRIVSEEGERKKSNIDTIHVVKEFLDKYGYRSDVRSLASPRWVEDPSSVITIARTMASGSRNALPEYPRPKVPILLAATAALARAYLELREELRDLLDCLLWAQRKVLQAMDHLLAMEGTIYNHTLEEIHSFAKEGVSLSAREGMKIEFHQKCFRTGNIPERFFVDGYALERNMESTTWEGIPTSGGRTRGKTRVVYSIQDALKANPNDILVTTSMGPTWTSILPLVAGVVLAEGSMLDHFSIIAREYGVPCIVGVGPGILNIPNGTDIEMDGYEGRIWEPK